MANLSRNRPPVQVSQFSMVPRGDVPRSTFRTQHMHKTTFQTGRLIPIHVDEVLPGDVHRGNVTVFARLATPLFPIMDNLRLETFFFFVPCRLVWSNWRKFMGEQTDPSSSIAFTIPVVTSAVGGWPVSSIGDYMGLPTVGQLGGAATKDTNALPMRAYNLIYNEWFRDENLSNSQSVPLTDGPDAAATYSLLRRCKKHDYFTSALPWPLKGGVQVSIPLSGTARLQTDVADEARIGIWSTVANGWRSMDINGAAFVALETGGVSSDAEKAYVDLSTATGATLNALRLSVTTQQFLERDARGGTRYTELLRSHFGVMPEDARLQRPEYIGGGRSDVQTSAIPQTSATGLTGGTTPAGSLSAAATITGSHEFSYTASEHGYILGLVHVGADLTYQQGVHRMWTRSTRYDFYWPAFAHLGEQAIRNDEIYVRGDANDPLVFGYQERWAEYRHRPSRVSGLFRSTSAGNIDEWHLAQQFTALPVLNEAFMLDTPPMSRVLAAGAAADEMQILFDSMFNIACTRALPTYSVPGLNRF